MSSWKSAQSKRQIAKKTKWALVILAAVLGLLVIGRGVKLTQILFTPWQESTLIRNYRWNGAFNINILLRAKEVSLLSYSPQNQTVTIIDIPNNSYLEAAKGFGKWELRSIYDLGGGQLLKDTLANLFGLPIDGFLNFSGKYYQSQTSSLVEDLRKNPIAIISMLPYLKTDLTPFELIRLKIGLSGVRFDKMKQINLEKADVLEKEKLADGTDILSPDTVKLDSILSGMVDPALQSEHKTIAIFNSTNHLQLAQKAARLITNVGGDVIITTNGKNKIKTTQVFGIKSKTLQRLKQIFNASDTIDPVLEDVVSSRAEINLFLGEDYFDRI